MEKGLYPVSYIVCEPSRSASRSASREYFRNSDCTPNDAELRDLPGSALSDGRAQNCQGELRECGFAGLLGGMTQNDVGDFVRHHACQLAFVIRRLNSANVYVDRAPRESEGIDLLDVHHMETKRPFVWTRRMRRQLLTELLHILCDRIGFGKHRHLAIHFRRSLPANLNILLRRVLVERGGLDFNSPGWSLNNVFRGAAQAERQDQIREQSPDLLPAYIFHGLPNSLRAISQTRVSDSMGNVPVV